MYGGSIFCSHKDPLERCDKIIITKGTRNLTEWDSEVAIKGTSVVTACDRKEKDRGIRA